jgi:hypothetical protein
VNRSTSRRRGGRASERLSLAYTEMESFELYLYELDDVNLGQYSPTETKVAKEPTKP